MAQDHSIDDVHFEVRGRAGVIVLDRPKALNALTRPMVVAIRAQLLDWATDPAVGHVVVTSTSEKAFCAGGDVRRIHDLGRAGETGLAAFFADEYRMNQTIHRFPKPYTSLIDGICMGGGVGLSVHAPYRVGTKRMLFAMPEVTIGFFPDVGGSHFLSRLPGGLGAYFSMTGRRAGIADCAAAGIVTHVADEARIGELMAALTEVDDPAPVLERFRIDPGEAPLAPLRPTIDRLFVGDDAAAIVAALESESGPDADWAKATAAEIRTKSPTSVAVALHQVRIGGSLDFEACMRIEYRIVSHILGGSDFYEGVHSVLVDRTAKPVWRPARIEDLDRAAIDAHFTTVPADGDLTF